MAEEQPQPQPQKEPIPKIVFIVPYRDRNEHRIFFSNYIHYIMADVPREEWDYFFVHQRDSRPFNRGAMKNIGFLAMKYKYPEDYKNITLVFNDVDTLPHKKNLLDYATVPGVIKHFYGFQFALGGIFSIKAGDFERTNGFPNFWAWGGEDNYMQTRVLATPGLAINRDTFYKINDRAILQFLDGFNRLICRSEIATTLRQDNIDGITTIKNLHYDMHGSSGVADDDPGHFIDVTYFETAYPPEALVFETQDLRDGNGKIKIPDTLTGHKKLLSKTKGNGVHMALGQPPAIIGASSPPPPPPSVRHHAKQLQQHDAITNQLLPMAFMPVVAPHHHAAYRRTGMRSLVSR